MPSPASSYHSSPTYPAPPVPYGLQRQYVSGYTMSPHTPMSMGPSPSFAYGFPHTDNMMTQPIHASYPSMLQPHPTSMYHYQRGSPDGGPSLHPPSQGAGPSQMYQHPVGPPGAPPPPLSPQTSNPPSFSGTSQFHSLQYHPHTPPYSYPPQSFPSTPTHFQPQYPYAQAFSTPSPDREHGTWWYVHPHPQTPQYEGHPPYAGHYSMPYPSLQPDVDQRYSQSNTPASTPSTSGVPFQSTPIPHGESAQPPISTLPRSPTSPADPPPLSPAPSSLDSRTGPNPLSERHITRRSYHPNPPAHRSEWVMWVGNVPSDATHDEAWRFFTAPTDTRDQSLPKDNGVLSIFLISRSCCVFVNFDNDEHLRAGIEQFNGVPLRPNDPRCPKLVCRVRRMDDDLKAGVGGQRGSGIHMRWIKEQKKKRIDHQPAEVSSSEDPPTSPSEYFGQASVSSDEDGHVPRMTNTQTSSSGGSFASTTSSMLAKHFPQRFFILKSLTQYDLDLSVERGLWATQKHNEGILDQAYRSSKDVFLIFGVNKSGEFYGYARMAGPLRRGEPQVSWASRTDSSASSRSPLSPSGLQQETIAEESVTPASQANHQFLSPVRQVANSPGVITPDSRADARPHPKSNSAPPVFGHYQQFSGTKQHTNLSLDRLVRTKVAGASSGEFSRDFELDAGAPQRAIRDRQSTEEGSTGSKLHVVEEVEEKGAEDDGHAAEGQAPPADGDSAWGDSFKVDWICTERLPFQRTRLLRNPWNHDKEIKVSRDGTELEPTVGRQLLDEWEKYVQEIASGELRPTTGGLKYRVAANQSTPSSSSIISDVSPAPGTPMEPKERKPRAS
ncbi:hypothetical protein PTI98_011236 [Pleurotus ostreatus]|nr:hypothetical protein PTI98_011236 [Pleurotus ostreatus]